MSFDKNPEIQDNENEIIIQLNLKDTDQEEFKIVSSVNYLTEGCDNVNNNKELLGQKLNISYELSDFCRCCLEQNENLVTIFDKNIEKQITDLFGVKICTADELPGKICNKCCNQLKESTIFKERIENTNITLKLYLEENPIQEKDVEVFPSNLLECETELNENLESKDSENSLQISYLNENNEVHVEEIDVDFLDEFYEKQNNITNSNCNENENISIILDEKTLENNKKPVLKLENEIKISLSKKISCPMCKKVFNDKSKFQRHVKIHILQEDHFTCCLCKRGFKDSISLEIHQKCHKQKNQLNENFNDTLFKCNNCEEFFSVENDLKIHQSIHEKIDDNFICKKCEKKFSSLHQLKRHIPIHFENKPYKCEICGHGFPEMGSLTRHFRKHTELKKAKKFLCKLCDKKYYDAQTLSIHIRKHTGEKPWSCKICEKGFIDVRLLNSHMKTHKNEKQYKCNVCEKSFTHQSSLSTHHRLHTGEKPYVCNICKKSFIQSSNLNLHLRVHSGEKPYKCDKCQSKFASSSTLRTHKRTHTCEKQFKCNYCGIFFMRHHLTEHLRVHTGEKPYECKICLKKFTRSTQLKQHNKIHNKNEKYSKRKMKKSTNFLKEYENQIQIENEFSENEIIVNDLLASIVKCDMKN